jgi:hypothetical protein
MDYVSQPGYDSAKKPGICFGVSHIEQDGRHEFKMHFNDQEADDEWNLPSQMRPVTDRYESMI